MQISVLKAGSSPSNLGFFFKGGNTTPLTTVLNPTKISHQHVSVCRNVCILPGGIFTFASWGWGSFSAALHWDPLGELRSSFQWIEKYRFSVITGNLLCAKLHVMSHFLPPCDTWALSSACCLLASWAPSIQASPWHSRGFPCPSLAFPQAALLLLWLQGRLYFFFFLFFHLVCASLEGRTGWEVVCFGCTEYNGYFAT